MRLRLELLAALVAAVALLTVAALEGSRRNRGPSLDPRRSTYLDGPFGASAWAAGLDRLGVVVERRRRSLLGLADDENGGTLPVVAILDPSWPLTTGDAADLAAYADRKGDLLLAGAGTEIAARCFGFGIDDRGYDSTTARPPGTPPGPSSPRVVMVLARYRDSIAVDSSAAADRQEVICRVHPARTIDTLLVSATGRAVALRLTLANHTRVTLVADGGLFGNRALRDTDAGPFALGLVAGRYPRVVVDEFHHGFDAGGSLSDVLYAWSIRSPWGWLLWQLAAVGILALLAGAVRFGAPRSVISRQRRSPLEHVRALATALAASRGHDVAVALQIQGLRRRLGRGTRSAATPGARREEAAGWLRRLGEGVRTPRALEAVRTLQELIARPQPAAGVLRAASAVEDVWEELRP